MMASARKCCEVLDARSQEERGVEVFEHSVESSVHGVKVFIFQILDLGIMREATNAM